jgi:hypothetical protein
MVGPAMLIAIAARTTAGQFMGCTRWVGDLGRPLAVVAAETGIRGLDTDTGGRSPRKVQEHRDVGRLAKNRRDATALHAAGVRL